MSGQENESTEIAKEALTLSGSNYLCRVIFLVRGLGVAALLQPEIYGIWSVLKSLQDSTAFANLGASHALLREIAMNKGSREQHSLQSTSLNLALLVTFASSTVLLILSFTPALSNIGAELRISLIVMMLSVVTYHIPRQLLAHKDFYFLARYLLIYALLNSLFSLVAVYFWGLTEMLWGLVLTHILAVLFVLKNGRISFSTHFNRPLAAKLVSSGLPVMVGAALFFFLRAADQFLVYAFIGATASGYYAISNFVAMTVTQIPVALASALFPRMMERHSGGASRQEIEHLFFEPLKLICVGVPILLGLTYFALEPMLVYVLPNYLPALDVIRIALLGIFFQSIWSLSHPLLLAFEKQRQQMQIGLALLLLNIAAVYLTISNGGSVEAVSWVASGMGVVSAIAILSYTFRLLDRASSANAKTLWDISWPITYGVACCLLIDHKLSIEATMMPVLVEALAKMFAFGLSSLPLLAYLWQAWSKRNQSVDETANRR
ncbi:MAG: oligosaccharide flippase family protein [Pseudomonadales bacterium]